MKCRLCGRGALEIRGWLERVNEKGVPGIWECRPRCDAELSDDDALLGAIEWRMTDPERPDAARAAAEEYDWLFAGTAVSQLAAIIRRHFPSDCANPEHARLEARLAMLMGCCESRCCGIADQFRLRTRFAPRSTRTGERRLMAEDQEVKCATGQDMLAARDELLARYVEALRASGVLEHSIFGRTLDADRGGEKRG